MGARWVPACMIATGDSLVFSCALGGFMSVLSDLAGSFCGEGADADNVSGHALQVNRNRLVPVCCLIAKSNS